jgi:hypothetical protein
VNYWKLPGKIVSEVQPVEKETVGAGDSGGLPRPSDYDDYWYEADDGMWYNEYDDELEEGQYYEEIPEEEGYPKPDLTAVVDEEPYVEPVPTQHKLPVSKAPPAQTQQQPKQVAKPVPDKSKEAAELKAAQEAEIKAAKEAAKAAGDAAKNILGGAMGGLLGGLGGKPQQKQSGFSIGGFGMGPKKPVAPNQQQQKKPPQPQQQQQNQQQMQQKQPSQGQVQQGGPQPTKVQGQQQQGPPQQRPAQGQPQQGKMQGPPQPDQPQQGPQQQRPPQGQPQQGQQQQRPPQQGPPQQRPLQAQPQQGKLQGPPHQGVPQTQPQPGQQQQTTPGKQKPMMKKQGAVSQPSVDNKEAMVKQTTDNKSELEKKPNGAVQIAGPKVGGQQPILIKGRVPSKTGPTPAQPAIKKVSIKENKEAKQDATNDKKEDVEDKPAHKQREERQINKTRTMRPKEKWEWAFGKIMNTFEVRADPRTSAVQPLHILTQARCLLLSPSR